MKFGTVLRDADGITVMYIGTLIRHHKVDEADGRECSPGERVMLVLDRGTYDARQKGEQYWLVGKTGWVNEGWNADEVTE